MPDLPAARRWLRHAANADTLAQAKLDVGVALSHLTPTKAHADLLALEAMYQQDEARGVESRG